STDFQNCGSFNSDTTLFCLIEILKDNPSIVIEIGGHAWKEKMPKKLSIKRANYVKSRLINFGIDGERIVTVGYGNKQPFITREHIIGGGYSKADENETLRRMNRQAQYKIISFDYGKKNDNN